MILLSCHETFFELIFFSVRQSYPTPLFVPALSTVVLFLFFWPLVEMIII